MPNKRYNVYQIDISTLLHWIKDGNIGIPEMQRPFAWKPKQGFDRFSLSRVPNWIYYSIWNFISELIKNYLDV